MNKTSFSDDHGTGNGEMGFYKKPAGFPTLQELSGGFSSKVEKKVEAPNSRDISANVEKIKS